VALRRVEFAVVGAGLLGLATARALADRGREVVVLEASTVGHDRGGSKGTARIFRTGYPDPLYVAMALAAGRAWEHLEGASGRRLLDRRGQVDRGSGIGEVAEALRAVGAPFEEVDEAEAARRWPALAPAGPVLYEATSGVLAADQCLAALGGGLEVLEHRSVRRVRDDGRRVRLDCADDVFEVSVVVVCAGTASSSLLDLPDGHLMATLEQVAYFGLPAGAAAPPILIEWDTPMVYGLPEPDGRRYKLAFHGAGPACTMADVALEPDEAAVAAISEAAARLFCEVDPSPVGTERCFYDNSPDTDFVIDRRGQVVVGAGTSGHGFKFGPLLGTWLADLATGTPPAFDLARFARSRPGLHTA
jgi:sarcosine oxidase